MPKIDKIFTLEITPEQFLNACSAIELQEIMLLIGKKQYQDKMIDYTVEEQWKGKQKRLI